MPEQQMSEAQIAELKEKIKNMSPEELREFQKKQCIFCQIISGKVQSKRIFEDDKSLAILDINPANPGHILLMPKEHYSIMPQIPENILQHLFMASRSLSNAALRGLGVSGINILVANGVAAGQKANHFMIHIIPRKENDGLDFELPQKKISEKELTKIRDKLNAKIASLTGKKAAMNAAKQVVEAEFEEAPTQEERLPEPASIAEEKKQEIKKEKPEPKEQPKKIQQRQDKKSEGGVSLDDISRLFGK